MNEMLGKNLIGHDKIIEFSTNKVVKDKKTVIGIVVKIDTDNVYIYNDKNPGKYKWYTIEKEKVNKYINDKIYTTGRKINQINDYMLKHEFI